MQLNLLIVGQVDGDGLGAGVAVPGVVDHVVGVEIRVRSRRFGLVGVIHRQAALQLGQERGKACQPLAPGQILDQHVGLKRRAIAVELIFVGFNRANDHVNGVVLHIHPGQIAGLVAIGRDGVSAQVQITLELRIVGIGGRLAQQCRGFFKLRSIFHVVGDNVEPALFVATDQRIQTGFAAY